jgi:hypothetical protein
MTGNVRGQPGAVPSDGYKMDLGPGQITRRTTTGVAVNVDEFC